MAKEGGDSDARDTGADQQWAVGGLKDRPVSATRDYRLSAEQCRRGADAAVDEVSKVMWRVFAEEWLKLADAELSARRAPPK
jgi:hypothetical protein